MSTTMVPLTITPGAAARVAELGMQADLERMIEHCRQVVPELLRIEVEHYVRADDDSPPGVCVTATTARPWEEVLDIDRPIGRWKVTTFPPEVCQHFLITVDSDR